MMDFTYLSNKGFDKKEEKKKGIPMTEINSKILECQEKLKDIKYRVSDITDQWKSLTEDYSIFSFAKSIDSSIRESFQKAIDDLKMEYEDTKSTLNYYKDIKNKTLLESGLEEDNIKSFEVDKDKVIETISDARESVDRGDKPSDTLEILFKAFVPKSGKSATVGGELVRAMMRLLYRDMNDGDIFYRGAGVESCGPEAQYLINTAGYLAEFTDIIEREKDGADYTGSLIEICKLLIDYLLENPNLFYEINTVDSRKVSIDELKNLMPKLTFIKDLSSDLVDLIENDDVKEYDIIEELYSEFASYIDDIDNIKIDLGTVTISDLDYNGLQELENHFDKWEEDFVKDLESNQEDE